MLEIQDQKFGTMLERIDNALVELLKSISLEEIPGVLTFLSARLLREGSARHHKRSERTIEAEDQLLTAGQLAERCNLPESWVRNEERVGRSPGIRAGRYVRFKLSEVEKALREREQVGLKSRSA